MGDAECLNKAALESLQKMAGAKFAIRMIDLFFSTVPPKLAEFQPALSAGDYHQVQDVAHFIKSSCRNIGAAAMQDASARLEQAAREGKADAIPGLLQEMEQAYAAVKVLLEEERRILSS